jgi:hypothetical protein
MVDINLSTSNSKNNKNIPLSGAYVSVYESYHFTIKEGDEINSLQRIAKGNEGRSFCNKDRYTYMMYNYGGLLLLKLWLGNYLFPKSSAIYINEYDRSISFVKDIISSLIIMDDKFRSDFR